MTGIWPWLAVAAAGALHGLNPASGWLLAAAWGVRGREWSRALRALLPIAIGHAASVAIVATAVAVGLSLDRLLLQAMAAALLAVVVVVHLWERSRPAQRTPSGPAALALWSFIMSTAHGAGLMLVPALVPLCIGNTASGTVGASDPLMLAVAAVGVHTAAMLAVTAIIASGVCRGVDAGVRLLRSRKGKLQS
ncbi:MAG TPA: hypothetical protein VIM12_02390 [Noviherbaspirillum sp.]|jgi:hypothetical protein|uniref:hypothetical protein n=1 Tax=Noviherbaspirillum sp. TaxID=1926288 RepID=UPI002F921ACA